MSDLKIYASDPASIEAVIFAVGANIICGNTNRPEVLQPEGKLPVGVVRAHGKDVFYARNSEGVVLVEPLAVVRYMALESDKAEVLGKSHAEAAQVVSCEGWANAAIVADGDEELSNLLQQLSIQTKSTKFLVGDTITTADVAAWGAVQKHNLAGKLKDSVATWWKNISEQKAFRVSVAGAPKKEKTTGSNTQADQPVSDKQIAKAKQLWSSSRIGSCDGPIVSHPILPVKGKRNVLVTSALPYVNNVPHLGNIIGCVLSADVFARFTRLRGDNVLYVCGTDEYGTATETKARAEGLSPREICDKYNAIHTDIYKWFNIGFDHFGRTTTDKQTEIAQEIFWGLHKNDWVEQKAQKQWYCGSCDTFLADRFVEGTCYLCGYDDARGDQCDQCGQPLHADQLTKTRCKFNKGCKAVLELRDSEHLFVKLGHLQPATQKWATGQFDAGHFSKNAQKITLDWFNKGLDSRAITRDLKWGTPVPLKGFEKKVFYVWYDAPIGYLSITANYTDQWKKWWMDPENVELYQFMAKDNVPFHAIIFPACLIGSGENWTKVKHISATEYLTYEGKPFSKSRGVGVFGDQAREIGLSADIFRFYLLFVRPETGDTDFTWSDFIAKVNNELNNNLGNFVHRALSLCHSNFKGIIPELVLDDRDYALIAQVNKEIRTYIKTLEKDIQVRWSLRALLAISGLGNQYLQTHMPWKLMKSGETERAGTVIGLAVHITHLIATLLQPFMPERSERLLEFLNAKVGFISENFVPRLPSGHQIGKSSPLFPKIEEKQAEEWRERYKGTDEPAPAKAAHPNKVKAAKSAKASGDQPEKKAKKEKAPKQKQQKGPKVSSPLLIELQGKIRAQALIMRDAPEDQKEAERTTLKTLKDALEVEKQKLLATEAQASSG